MSIKINLSHKVRINRRLYTRGLPRVLEELTNKSVKALANTVADFFQEVGFKFYGVKSGRIYVLPDGTEHQASAPGEFPANMTGNLLDKIIAKYTDNGDAVHEYKITSTAPYSKELEYGGRKVAARPFMRPMLTGRVRQFLNREFKNKVRVVRGKKIEDYYTGQDISGKKFKTTMSGKDI